MLGARLHTIPAFPQFSVAYDDSSGLLCARRGCMIYFFDGASLLARTRFFFVF